MILGQEPRKRFKEDKKISKVEKGRLGREEGSPRVLLLEKILGARILREKLGQRACVLIKTLCGSPLEDEHVGAWWKLYQKF